jgi:formate hydrogenlyase subunit 3/multisubunit Na+/H+ antiporter MnhD subunit
MSEFTILRAALAAGHPWIAAVMLVMLAIIFVGMAALVLGIALGEPEPGTVPVRESSWLVAGPLALAAVVLMLGVYIPGPLHDVLARGAAALGGTAP